MRTMTNQNTALEKRGITMPYSSVEIGIIGPMVAYMGKRINHNAMLACNEVG
jgi:hypothetical protein